MDGSRWAERFGRPRSTVVVLVLVALLATVAIASAGPTPSGSGGARRPSEWLLDVFVSLFLVVMAFGTVLLVLLVLLRPALLIGDDASEVHRPRNRAGTLLSLVLLFALLAVATWRVTSSDGAGRDLARIFGTGGDAAPVEGGRYEPEFQVVPVIVTLAIGAIALAFFAGASRARARSLPQHPPDLSAALADVIDDTLDDLRAELDARRAVIAAYGRLEHVLAAYGAPRHASEAPQEYLERVLVDLEVPRAAVSRLTALFTRAKFSHHEVVATMKDEAIEALETVRDGLREAQERAEAERAHARALARELSAR